MLKRVGEIGGQSCQATFILCASLWPTVFLLLFLLFGWFLLLHTLRLLRAFAALNLNLKFYCGRQGKAKATKQRRKTETEKWWSGKVEGEN